MATRTYKLLRNKGVPKKAAKKITQSKRAKARKAKKG